MQIKSEHKSCAISFALLRFGKMYPYGSQHWHRFIYMGLQYILTMANAQSIHIHAHQHARTYTTPLRHRFWWFCSDSGENLFGSGCVVRCATTFRHQANTVRVNESMAQKKKKTFAKNILVVILRRA